MAASAFPRLDSSNNEDEDEEIARMVKESLDEYLRNGQADYLLDEPHMRDFENQLRERLRDEHVRVQAGMSEIKRSTEVQLLSFPSSFLDRPLPDLLQKTDNPDSIDELFSRLVKLVEDNEEDLESHHGEGNEGAGVRTGSDVQGWLDQTKTAKVRADRNQASLASTNTVAVDDFVTVHGDSDSTVSSEELYATPLSSASKDLLLPPPPPPADQGDGKVRVTKTAHRRNGHSPTVPPKDVVPPRIPAVFQFMGDPNKEPRMVQPGEILYSATGSPITIARPPGSATTTTSTRTQPGTTNSTPSSTVSLGRPITLTVNNPDGQPIRVDLVCREGEQEVFRNFITDVRGLITTRSLRPYRRLPPRLPVTSRRVTSATGKKPIWK